MLRSRIALFCATLASLTSTTLSAQSHPFYLGVSAGATRLTAPRGNFPQTTAPTIAASVGMGVTHGFGFEGRLTGLSAAVTERRNPGVLSEGLYTRGVRALLLEPTLTFRPTAWNAWRVKPFGSVGAVLAALRTSQESDTPEEWSSASEAGVAGALGLEAVLYRRISLVGRASYREMFTGLGGPQRELGLPGPALDFGVRVNR
ncbi:MAG: outer membrane beta-barrel protein [Gemmatimonas sp.]